MIAVISRELGTFALAAQFLTRLPVPVIGSAATNQLAASVRYYPLVGSLIGGFSAAIFCFANLALPGIVAILLALAACLALTGALHEDGLADTFDGLGAKFTETNHLTDGDGTDNARRAASLAVMRDSRLGSFGAMALMLALGMRVATLASLETLPLCVALIAGGGLSRLSCIVTMQTSTYVRENGIATPIARRLTPAGWIVSGGTGLALLAMLFWLLAATTALYAMLGVVLGHALMRLTVERRLRGYTGDTLGAVQQTSEIGLYLGVCVGIGAWG